MTTISTLPTELLSIIFNKFDKLTHLAACRLVCKAWKDPVEREMLGHTITITQDFDKVDSLYAFLQISTTRTNLIKHLNFDSMHSYRDNSTTMGLLELIAGSSVESITGHIGIAPFFDVFTKIVQSSPDNLDKMKTLTLFSERSAEPPLGLALHCRDTIQTMELNFFNHGNGKGIRRKFIDRLVEFHHLTSFTLTTGIHTIESLNRILDNCPHLQNFSLSTFSYKYHQDNGHDLKQKAEKKHTNLKTLKFRDEDCSSYMIEYLVYKLVNLQNISIDVVANDYFTSEEELVRIPTLIQQVPQKELVYKVDAVASNVPSMSSWLIKSGYSVTVETTDDYYDTRIMVVW